MAILTTIAVLAVLLAVAVPFERIARIAGFPAPAAIVLVGIAGGSMMPGDLRITLTPQMLGLFLPALIFEGAWALDTRVLRREWPAIAVLAIPGTLLTAFLIGAAAVAFAGLSFAAAFALGALLAATDPVAVLALFRKLDLPRGLLALVDGESIANDGVAAVLVQVAVAFAAGAGSVAAFAGLAFYAAGAGIAIGLALALLGAPLLRRFPRASVGIGVTVAVAYGAYALAGLAGASGIFAAAAAGVALPRPGLDANEVRAIVRFWDLTSFGVNGLVFLLVGLNLQLPRMFAEPRLFVAVVLAVVSARLILAFVLVPIDRRDPTRRGWRRAIAFAGLRGALSLALALGLPRTFPNRPQVIDAVFAVVFLTIVVQGWTLEPVLRRLPFARQA